MISFWVRKRIKYDGTQMKPHWALTNFNIEGDCIVAFRGQCDIPDANILDLEDLLARKKIRGRDMVHFIVEHFSIDLEKGILYQRILASMIKDVIERSAKCTLRRDGDDIYDGGRKLSISIAASTPVSVKIHFAVNVVEEKGVDVKTKGIAEYGMKPDKFCKEVMKMYLAEFASIQRARVKVRPSI